MVWLRRGPEPSPETKGIKTLMRRDVVLLIRPEPSPETKGIKTVTKSFVHQNLTGPEPSPETKGIKT